MPMALEVLLFGPSPVGEELLASDSQS